MRTLRQLSFAAMIVAGLLGVSSAKAVTFNGATIITGDADSGISAAKSYTHLLDLAQSFSAGTTVNGVNFTNAGLGGPNWTLTGATTDCCVNANTGVTAGSGVDTMLRDFFHHSGGGDAQLTLTGLTPGTTYEARVYFRQFGAGADRTNTVKLNTGLSADAVTYNTDAVNQAGYLSFTYVAGPTGTAVIDFTQQNSQNASWHHYGFTNEVAAPVSPKLPIQNLLLSDDFTTGVNGQLPNTNDININLAGRQSGLLSTIAYNRIGNVQMGNTGSGDKTILDNANVLLLAGGTSAATIATNFNNSLSQGGLKIEFDAAPQVRLGATNSSDWAAISIGENANATGFINGGHTHLGILFRENGGFQAFDGGALVGQGVFTSSPLEDDFYRDITLLLTDDSDGNPFDGMGQTDVEVLFGGQSVFTYSKLGGGFTNNYISFSANGIGYIDNLRITNTSVPEPMTGGLLLTGAMVLVRRRRRAA